MSYLDEEYLSDSYSGYYENQLDNIMVKKKKKPSEIDYLRDQLQVERYQRDKMDNERNQLFKTIQDLSKNAVNTFSSKVEGYSNKVNNTVDNPNGINISISHNTLLLFLFILVIILAIMQVLTLKWMRQLMSVIKEIIEKTNIDVNSGNTSIFD